MSYCRFSDGDVYMYHDVGGYVSCCVCRLTKELPEPWTEATRRHIARWAYDFADLFVTLGRVVSLGFWRGHLPLTWALRSARTISREPDPRLTTFQDALAHLYEHVAAGHSVPDYAFAALREEIETGLRPSDPTPPCEHGVASGENCAACQKKWAESWEDRDDDRKAFRTLRRQRPSVEGK